MKNNIEIKTKNTLVNDTKIPKIIHCTYFDKSKIPFKVWNNLKKYAKEYKIIFYDDEDCRNFFRKYFNEQYVSMFNNLRLGCHKADFFRYCVIYIKGGIYIDIKIVPKEYFKNIFDHNSNNLFYTCIGSKGETENIVSRYFRKTYGKGNGHIFQAILATYPGNKLMESLIKDFFIVNEAYKNYHIFTYKFYDLLYEKLNYHLYPGIHSYKNQKIILFKEINEKQTEKDIVDRHGGYFYIRDKNQNIIFRSRYPEFPWNQELENRNNITGVFFKVVNYIKKKNT